MLCGAGCRVNEVEFDDLTLLDLAVNSGNATLVSIMNYYFPSRTISIL